MAIIEKELKQYETTLSMERLKSFIRNENDTIDVLIERYVNNIKISQALYPELSILEVTLRNAINTTLCKYISDTWIEDEVKQQKILFEHEHVKLINSYNDVKKRYSCKRFSTGKVVANLNLGFWTGICSKKYNSLIWNRNRCFKSIFPNYNKNRQINLISNKLNSIRSLRNRIFHHEPILKNPPVLLARYNEILELLNYLPQNDAAILENTTNFLNTYNTIMTAVKSQKPGAL